MNIFKRYALTLALITVVITTGSWGFLVHKTTNQLAVYMLPGELRNFYYKNISYVVSNAPRPDIRRNTDSSEATKHFIDLEKFGDSAAWKMPLRWDDAVKQYTKDTLLLYGYVPYQIMFIKEKLTQAFVSRNADSILFYSADLGHYIGDAHVPLHVSINYDGQLTNQKGIHSLWESMIPELEIGNYDLSSSHKATYLSRPELNVRAAIEQAYLLLADVFGKEQEVSQTFTDSQKYRVQICRGKEYTSYTTAFAKEYNARLKNTINVQLISSAKLTADFWYTSWADAGKPDLEGLLKPSFSKKDKKELKKELKSYKRNTLIKAGLLRSKQDAQFTTTE